MLKFHRVFRMRKVVLPLLCGADCLTMCSCRFNAIPARDRRTDRIAVSVSHSMFADARKKLRVCLIRASRSHLSFVSRMPSRSLQSPRGGASRRLTEPEIAGRSAVVDNLMTYGDAAARIESVSRRRYTRDGVTFIATDLNGRQHDPTRDQLTRIRRRRACNPPR